MLSANGCVKPGVVVVNGKEERHAETSIFWNGAKRQSACALGGALPTPVHDGYARSELKALNHDAAVTTGKRHNGSLAAAVAGLVNRILKVVGHRINGSIIKLKGGAAETLR